MTVKRSFIQAVPIPGGLIWGAALVAAISPGIVPIVRAQAAAAEVDGAAVESARVIDRAAVERATLRVWPAVVRIHVVNAYYSEGRARKSESSGSGFIISPDGYVVTNHHVAGDAVRLVCTMSTREEIPARLVGTDAMSDIAVLKLEPEEPREFAYVEWGDSDQLKVGDPVLAMGSPRALSQSVTEGIVSNTSMTMPRWEGEFVLDGEDVGSIVRWIAHDAAIYGGNSGGPLVDLQGRIVGVNEISYGLGGAIPSNLARDVARQLIERGDVDRAFLGFLLQPLFKTLKSEQGAIISDVVKGSPAAEAGLRPGDRLLRIEPAEGKPIEVSVRFQEQLPPLNLQLGQLPIGEPVRVTFERDDQTQTVELKPVRRERVLREQKEFDSWGITGRNLSFWTALELKRATTNGVLVTSVRPGGPAGQAEPAIEAGDVIVRVGDREIEDMDTLTAVTLDLIRDADKPVPVLVAYERDGQSLLTQVKVGLEALNDPGQDVRRPWIPVGTQVLTRDLASALGIAGTTGVRVTQLYADEGAESTLGLRVGDIITAIDDTSIQASEVHDIEVFPTMVRQYRAGTEVTLTVLRDGEEITLTGKLVNRPAQAREMKRYLDHDFNFTVRDTAYMDYVTNQWEDRPEGVYVEMVERGGWMALAGLQVGDLLLAIGDEAVDSVDAVRTIMEKIKEERPRSVILHLRRGIHNRFVEVEPNWELVTEE